MLAEMGWQMNTNTLNGEYRLGGDTVSFVPRVPVQPVLLAHGGLKVSVIE